jgi:dihydroneopterin aldolase
MTINTSLAIQRLELDVNLGCYAIERSQKERIRCDINIRFAEPPAGCDSDQLEDTHCYNQLIADIKHYLKDRDFQLIEHLAKTLYSYIKDYFSNTILLSLKITKNPPIPNLIEGVSFSYGDNF